MLKRVEVFRFVRVLRLFASLRCGDDGMETGWITAGTCLNDAMFSAVSRHSRESGNPFGIWQDAGMTKKRPGKSQLLVLGSKCEFGGSQIKKRMADALEDHGTPFYG